MNNSTNVSLSRRFLLGFAAAATAVVSVMVSGCDSNPAAQASPVHAAAPPSYPSASLAQPAPLPGPVSETQEPRSFVTTGPLVAEQQADIAAERDGRIAQVLAEIGDRVQKGQLLSTLDDRMLQAACDSQQARIDSLQAQVHEWEAEQKTEEADLRPLVLAAVVVAAERAAILQWFRQAGAPGRLVDMIRAAVDLAVRGPAAPDVTLT